VPLQLTVHSDALHNNVTLYCVQQELQNPVCGLEAHAGQRQACDHKKAGCITDRLMLKQEMTITGVEQAIATHLSAEDVRAMTKLSRSTGANLGCGMSTRCPLNIAELFWCCLAASKDGICCVIDDILSIMKVWVWL